MEDAGDILHKILAKQIVGRTVAEQRQCLHIDKTYVSDSIQQQGRPPEIVDHVERVD